MRRRVPFFLVLCLLSPRPACGELLPRTWLIGTDERSALIGISDTTRQDEPRPLILGFHGHGGSAEHAARRFRRARRDGRFPLNLANPDSSQTPLIVEKFSLPVPSPHPMQLSSQWSNGRPTVSPLTII